MTKLELENDADALRRKCQKFYGVQDPITAAARSLFQKIVIANFIEAQSQAEREQVGVSDTKEYTEVYALQQRSEAQAIKRSL